MTLEFTLVRACVRACVRAFGYTILKDYSLDFSEILHEVTTTQRRKSNIPGFLIKILVASPGGQKGSKMVILTLFGT